LDAVYDHGRGHPASSAAHGAPEVSRTPHPGRRGQHGTVPGQAASRERPLRRRAASTPRPARVRIRRRKPCTLCRRRLFGWYVRLVIGPRGSCRCAYGSSHRADGKTLVRRRAASVCRQRTKETVERTSQRRAGSPHNGTRRAASRSNLSDRARPAWPARAIWARRHAGCRGIFHNRCLHPLAATGRLLLASQGTRCSSPAVSQRHRGAVPRYTQPVDKHVDRSRQHDPADDEIASIARYGSGR
jgi:hypothetical protein